jgi:hypothetical protein
VGDSKLIPGLGGQLLFDERNYKGNYHERQGIREHPLHASKLSSQDVPYGSMACRSGTCGKKGRELPSVLHDMAKPNLRLMGLTTHVVV